MLSKSQAYSRALRTAVIGALALLAGCSNTAAGDIAAATKGDSAAARKIKNPVVVTPPPPPPTSPTTTIDFSVPADIADNFPTANGIETYGLGLAEQGQLPPESGDPVGAFRVTCPGSAAKVGQFDPMVFPGQAQAGHMHTFGVNDGISPNTTYTSLRTSGSGCNAPASYAVYRSAFWFPSMLDGAGNAVMPDYFNTYYKQLPATDPNCQIRATACVPLPNGLRFVEGWNMTTMTGGPGGYFECWIDDNQSQRVPGTGRTGSIATLVAQGCGKPMANGKYPLLVYQTGGPECWDGKNIDSADHRSHVAYPNRAVTGVIGTGGNSNYGCPLTHPYLIPMISIRLVFTTDANLATWRFSCDDMTATKVAGTCGHFDYWEAWSPTVKATWQKYCIDGHKSCSGGDLGNGTQIKGLVRWPQTWQRHVLVPLG